MARTRDNLHCSLCQQRIEPGATFTEHNFVLEPGTEEYQHYACARKQIEVEVNREWRELQTRRGIEARAQ